MGLVQFFRMFSKKTAELLYPLYKLTSSKIRWKWTEVENNAFEAIKKELMVKRTLAFPDWNKKFFVSVDASEVAYGATLYQLREDAEGILQLQDIVYASKFWSKQEMEDFKKEKQTPFIIEMISKKWSKAECNYSTSEKECLAIVNSLERWQQYLAPRDFVVYSDHKALQSLNKTNKPRLKR